MPQKSDMLIEQHKYLCQQYVQQSHQTLGSASGSQSAEKSISVAIATCPDLGVSNATSSFSDVV